MPRHECGVRLQGNDTEFHPDALIPVGPTAAVTVSAPVVDTATPPLTESGPALIDTGASESCIDAALAQRLQLPVIDQRQISGVAGVQTHDVVMAQLTVPALGLQASGRFTCVRLTDGGQPHQVLLGREFLRQVVMIYDGERGVVTLLR